MENSAGVYFILKLFSAFEPSFSAEKVIVFSPSDLTHRTIRAEGYMPTRPRSGSMGFLLSVSHRTGTQPIISSFQAGQIFLK